MRRTTSLILIGIVVGVLIAAPLRSHHAASAPQMTTGDTLTERELNRVLPTVDFDAVPFDRAVDEIQKLTPARITVDWDALKEAGFDRKAPVTIHGAGVYLWQALDRLTVIGSRAIGSDYPLGYEPRDGGIAIATVQQISRSATARLYDVRDLVFDVPPTAPGCFGPAPVPNPTSNEGLVRLIEETVAPESWRDFGGTVGSIYSAGGHMYIAQDWPGHRKVQELLRNLRAVQAASPPPTVEKNWSDVRQTWISPDLPEKLEALIRRPIDRVELSGVPLDQAIDSLQKMSGVLISVNWPTLAEVHVSRTTPVSVKTRDVSLSTVLALLFAQPIDGVLFGFTVEDGIVEISTRADMAKSTMTRIYDVRDFAAQAKPPERRESLETLTRLIVDTVEPESWRDNGGTIGSMREFQSRLIVTQTWSNHELIASLLDGLRKTGHGLVRRTQPGDK